METTLIFLLGMIVGGGLVFWKTKKDASPEVKPDSEKNKNKENESEKGTALSRELEQKKRENMQKLEEHLKENNRLTNDEVEKLLDVSHTSAYRYLEELEKAGIIRQIGKTGQSVYYEKN